MAVKYREPEIWKDIDGYSGYQVSSFGNVRNAKTGRILKRRGRLKDQVRLRDGGGRKKDFGVITLVGQAFIGKIPAGYSYCRKNDIKGDYHARNVAVEKGHRGQKSRACANSSRSRQVARIDMTGEIVDVYASIHEASRKTGLSVVTVRSRCRGYYIYMGEKRKFKTVFAPDGYCYTWDDEGCVARTLLQIDEELAGAPVFVDTRGYFSDGFPSLPS